MARMMVRQQPPPVTINRFLGINENSDGQFNLALGEASNMLNWRITPQFQLKKREGYKKIFEGLGTVQGMWYGKLNGSNVFLFCADGHLYKGNLSDGTKEDLGTLTDAPTRFIAFGTKVYLSNGHEYKSYDGTTFETVAGYRPLIAINAPPAGGGTLFEQLNTLTGAKRMTFSPDGASKVFQLSEKAIDSVDFVKKDGVLQTLTTNYTVDLVNGKVTFVATPATGNPGSVEIGWTKGTGQRDLIEKCRFSMDYSGQTDSRVFLWGNDEHKNRRFWSGLANGVPSAEYFEANSYSDEGNGQFAITDIVKQYDRQKIFLENGARYSYYDIMDIEGVSTASFPSFELSDEVGNVAFGQVQIVNNMPLSLYSGVHAWEASTVRDQTNQRLISQRVQESLNKKDLSKAVTYNYQANKEYWCCIDSIVWIYNYYNDTWYKFDNIEASCFLEVNGELYFGSNGYIAKFDKEKRIDEDKAINAVWEMGFYDFDAEYLTKFMNNVWVTINPTSKTSIDVQVVTNNEGTGDKQSVYYNLASYLHANYGHWSYNTSYNPQPRFVDVSANGFVYLKLIISNASESDVATVLSINMPVRYGGKVR